MQFFLLLLLLTTLYSKDFSVILRQPFDAQLFDITENYDRTLSAIGVSRHFKHGNSVAQNYTNAFDYLVTTSKKYGLQMNLLQVDNNATIIHSKIIKLRKFTTTVSLTKTPTDGYFVGGYTKDGLLLIAKLNAHAKVIRSVVFGTKNFNKMSKIVLLHDGGILAIGSSSTSRDTTNPLFTTGLGKNDVFITRFDENLHILWSKKYGTCYDDIGVDATEAFDGTLVVLSNTFKKNHHTFSLMRLTQDGDTLWLKNFTTTTLIKPTRIITLQDTNFLISLIEYDKKNKEHIRLLKCDLYSNILLDTRTILHNASGLYDIKEFCDGSFMGVGYSKTKNIIHALAIHFDTTLHKQNSTLYGNSNYNIFYALSILHNSQVAVAGVHIDKYSQEKNMWVMKLHKDTTIVKLPTVKTLHVSSLYTQLQKLFASEITHHQLTLSENLTLTLSGKSLLFKAGTYQLTIQQKQFLQRFFHKLIPFLKQHKSDVEALQVNGHTSTEWKHTSSKKSYLKNMKLSQNRALNVIKYLIITQNTKELSWLSKLLEGDGKSYKEQIIKHKKEDKTRSRRVSFRIIPF